MMKLGFNNVKNVLGGGDAMEKYFEYYMSSKYKTQIVNPQTGKVIILKQGK